jgi:thiol-disulfide isomerase/thioredoxin
MAKARWSLGLVTAGLLALGLLVPASAQTGDKFSPTYKQKQADVDGVLGYRPRQAGVDYSRPTAEEQKSLTLKVIMGDRPNSTGWLLLDPQGRPLRRFLDSNGDGDIDIWSYYKDGVEVYRDIASTYKKEKPDQFRWYNTGGSKWGVDGVGDGKISAWRMISAEEAAQEAFAAVVTRDFARLRALFITESEMATALKLPEAQVARIRDAQAKAAANFQELAKIPSLVPQSQLIRVESAVPQCMPADARGPLTDVLRFPNRAILYETTDKKKQPEWLHTGEMIQVGAAWRLTGVPSQTEGPVDSSLSDETLKPLMEKLADLDKNVPPAYPPGPKNQRGFDYNLKRAALIEQIYPKVADPKEKETWVKQLLDNLCNAYLASGSDNAVLARLKQYKDQLAASAAGSNLAAYAHFKEMWAKYAPLLVNSDAKVQNEWHEELAKFVQAYPTAEDTPDALIQLGMGCEFSGKEDQAKNYYQALATRFPGHVLAPKADGAFRRLSLNGQPMPLTGPTLSGAQFDMSKLQGKVIVVYYWATYCEVSIGDFARMKQMLATYGAKGFEVVAVNLNDRLEDAAKYVQANAAPGTHLFQAQGDQFGLGSPLAIQYGIMALPTMILVGKDGRVINRSIQINELDQAVSKAVQ